MAPKRGRPSTGFKANKKPAKADAEVPAWCSAVSKALDSATGLSESVVKMLVGVVPTSLALLKEERHGYQESAVAMIGEALAAKDAALDKAKAEAAAKLAEVTAEKGTLAAVVTEAEGAAKALTEAEEAAKKKVEEDTTALKGATEASKAAVAAEASGDAAAATGEATKTSLETVQKDHLDPLIEGTAAEMKASVKVVVKAAKDNLSLDSGLLDSLAPTLSKPKDGRGTFDGLVVKQLQEAFAAVVASLAASLAETVGGKEARTAAVASTAAAVEAAKATLEASEKALAEAKEATKAGEAKVKEAKATAKTSDPAMKKAAKESEAAEAASTAFKEGALKAYAELKDRVPPPPPPVEEEPVAEPAEPEPAPAEAAPMAA